MIVDLAKRVRTLEQQARGTPAPHDELRALQNAVEELSARVAQIEQGSTPCALTVKEAPDPAVQGLAARVAKLEASSGGQGRKKKAKRSKGLRHG